MSQETVLARWDGPPLCTLVETDGGLHFLVDHKCEGADVSLCFQICGMDETEARAFAEDYLPAFQRLQRLLTHCPVRTPIVEDGEKHSMEGYFSSRLAVEQGRLRYDCEMACIACGGALHYDFGPATASRAKRVAQAVRSFEDDLISLCFVAKHQYIDFGDWENEDVEWEDED